MLEHYENEEDQLKIFNVLEQKDIKKDQNTNKYVQKDKDKLIKKSEIYFKKSKKKEKIV